jgi:DNA-binding response OmpR family regulator
MWRWTMSDRLIALADEDPAFVRLLDHVLVHEGYRTVSLPDDRELADAIQWQRPDMLIVGVGPMREQAMAYLRQARLDSSLRDLPIVVCSTDLQFIQDNSAEYRSFGWDIVEEPFDLDDLLSRIKTALDRNPTGMQYAA